MRDLRCTTVRVVLRVPSVQVPTSSEQLTLLSCQLHYGLDQITTKTVRVLCPRMSASDEDRNRSVIGAFSPRYQRQT
jgi:hypothetical protein